MMAELMAKAEQAEAAKLAPPAPAPAPPPAAAPPAPAPAYQQLTLFDLNNAK
jgi:hypothetical protein